MSFQYVIIVDDNQREKARIYYDELKQAVVVDSQEGIELLSRSGHNINLNPSQNITFENYSFPKNDGLPFQVLMTNGDGTVSFVNIATALELELDDLLDVVITTPTDGQFISYNATTDQWENIDLVITTNFTELTDTPDTYVGEATKLLAVNANEDGIEFIDQQVIDYPVASVHGRTGDVIAEEGDYSLFYASFTQGLLADSATQPGDNVSDLLNDAGYLVDADIQVNEAPINGNQYTRKDEEWSVLGSQDIRLDEDIILSGASQTNGFDTQLLREFNGSVSLGDSRTHTELLGQVKYLDLTPIGSGGSQITHNNERLIGIFADDPTASVEIGTTARGVLLKGSEAGAFGVDYGDGWKNIYHEGNLDTSNLLRSGDNISLLVNDAGYITIGDIPNGLVTSVDGRTGDVTLTDLYAPVIHTHVKSDITDFNDADYATSTQGDLADTALQPGDALTESPSDGNQYTRKDGTWSELGSETIKLQEDSLITADSTTAGFELQLLRENNGTVALGDTRVNINPQGKFTGINLDSIVNGGTQIELDGERLIGVYGATADSSVEIGTTARGVLLKGSEAGAFGVDYGDGWKNIYHEGNLDTSNLLRSGDNISELANDAGYLQQIEQDVQPRLGAPLELNGQSIKNSFGGELLFTGSSFPTIKVAPTDSSRGQLILETGDPSKFVSFSGNGIIQSNNQQLSFLGTDVEFSANDQVSLWTLNGDVDVESQNGNVVVQGITYPKTDGEPGQALTTDGSGVLVWGDLNEGTLTDVVDDLTPQLGGDLDVNGHTITTSGNEVVVDVGDIVNGNTFKILGSGAEVLNISWDGTNAVFDATQASGIFYGTFNDSPALQELITYQFLNNNFVRNPTASLSFGVDATTEPAIGGSTVDDSLEIWSPDYIQMLSGRGSPVPTYKMTTLSGIDKQVLTLDADGNATWQDVGVAAGAVTSVFSRLGDVTAEASDYDASQIDNDSSVAGTFVSDALTALDSKKTDKAVPTMPDSFALLDGAGNLKDSILLPSAFATSTQGDLADTALQANDNVSVLTNDSGYISNIDSESIGSLSDVDLTGITDNSVLKWSNDKFIVAEDDDVTDFLSLEDTPASYAGFAGKKPVVNDSETGLVFKDGVNSVHGRIGDVVGEEGDYDLDLMGDVQLSTIQPNHTLVYDDSLGQWTNKFQSHSELSDLGEDTHQIYLLHDGTRTMTGTLNMGNNKIIDTTVIESSPANDLTVKSNREFVVENTDIEVPTVHLKNNTLNADDVKALLKLTESALIGYDDTEGLNITTSASANAKNINISPDTNGDVVLSRSGTGNIIINVITMPTQDGVNGQSMVTDGNGQISFADRLGPGDVSDGGTY